MRVSTLRDWRQWMWWFYLVFVVIGIVSVVRGGWVYVVYTPQAVLVGIVLAVVLAAVLVAIAHRIDRFEVTPPSIVASGLAWGGFACVPLALVVNDNMLQVFGGLGLADWAASLSAPIDEEAFKLIGTVALLYLTRRRVLRPMDGMFYGIVVGIGFEIVENILYAVQTASSDPNSDLGAALMVGITRILFGFGGHAIFAGISGYGVGYALTARHASTVKRVAAAFGGYAMAWFLHFLWDSPQAWGNTLAETAVRYLIMVVAFFTAVHFARREEKTWVREVLADQPSSVVGPGDVDALIHHHARREGVKRAKAAGGRRGKQAFKDLQEGQVVLANQLRTADAAEPDEVARQQQSVAQMRAEAERYGVVQPAQAS